MEGRMNRGDLQHFVKGFPQLHTLYTLESNKEWTEAIYILSGSDLYEGKEINQHILTTEMSLLEIHDKPNILQP